VFPALVLHCPPSTGISSTLDVLKKTTRKPVSVAGEAITEVALKACMNQAVEGMLITRYSRSSAEAAKMILAGEKAWVVKHFGTFGATALHRRNLFRDSALLGRTIKVKTSRRKGPLT
jgi:hypothetical protein